MEKNDQKDITRKKRLTTSEEIGEPPPNNSKMKNEKIDSISRGTDQGKKSILEDENISSKWNKPQELKKKNKEKDLETIEQEKLVGKIEDSEEQRNIETNDLENERKEEVRRREVEELNAIAKEIIDEEDRIFKHGTRREKAVEATRNILLRSDIQKRFASPSLPNGKIGEDKSTTALKMRHSSPGLKYRDNIADNKGAPKNEKEERGTKYVRSNDNVNVIDDIVVQNSSGSKMMHPYMTKQAPTKTTRNRYAVLEDSDQEEEKSDETDGTFPEGITYNVKYGSYSSSFIHKGRSHGIGVYGSLSMAKTAQSWIYEMIRGREDGNGEETRVLDEHEIIERNLAMIKLRSLRIMPHSSMSVNMMDPWELIKHKDIMKDENLDQTQGRNMDVINVDEMVIPTYDETEVETNLIGGPGRIRVQAGRLTVSLRIEGGESGLVKCEVLQAALEKGDLERIRDMQIWDVEFSHNEKENLIPSDGFCGYLGADQIVSHNSKCSSIKSEEDRGRIIANLEKLMRERRKIMEEKGSPISETDEVEVRTNAAIERLQGGDTRPMSSSGAWLSIGLIVGRGAEYGFSYWEHDGKKMQINDSQITKPGRPGTPYNTTEWEQILKDRMLCHKDKHFYIREGGLVKYFKEAMTSLISRVAESWRKGQLKGMLSELGKKIVKPSPPKSQVEDLEEGGGENEGTERAESTPQNSQGDAIEGTPQYDISPGNNIIDMEPGDELTGNADWTNEKNKDLAGVGSETDHGDKTQDRLKAEEAQIKNFTFEVLDTQRGVAKERDEGLNREVALVSRMDIPGEVLSQQGRIRSNSNRIAETNENGKGQLELFQQEDSDLDEQEESDQMDSDWETWIDASILDQMPQLYTSEEIMLMDPGRMKSVVFHEHQGFKQLWPAELELLRVIMENELPDGEDSRAALEGRTSYWRWRDWVIALVREDKVDERDMTQQVELMANMASFDLPEQFTQRPGPLSEVIGDTLIRRAIRLYDPKILIQEESEDSSGGSDIESAGKPTSRTSLSLSSPIKPRKYDKTLEITTVGNHGEGVFRLEVQFDTKKELSQDFQIKMEDMARAVRARLSMWKRTNGRIVRTSKPDIILGGEKEGFHEMKQGTFLSLSDIVKIARKELVTVAVEEPFGMTAYRVENKVLRDLISKLSVKIMELAEELTSWEMGEIVPTNLEYINCSADLLFASKKILVGNIPTDLVINSAGTEVMRRIENAVLSVSPWAKISEECRERISLGLKNYIQPGDVGVTGFSGGKVSYLVEILEPVTAGTSLDGGIDILARLPNDPQNVKGEYFTRQTLTTKEAEFIERMRQDKIVKSNDHVITILRIMNTRTGMLNVARRGVQEALTKLLGLDVLCITLSGKHSFEPNAKEETLLVALSTFQGGQELLRDTLGLKEDCPVYKLWIGSMELQGHLSMRTILNKRFMESEQRINLRRFQTDKGCDVITAHETNRYKEEGIIAMVKEYTHPLAHFDSWLALMKESRPEEMTAAPGSDRPPDRQKWPGRHVIINWEGGNVEKKWSILLNEPGSYAPLDQEEDMDVWHTGRKKKTEPQAELSDDKVAGKVAHTPAGKDTEQRIKRKEESPASDSSEWEAPKRRQRKQEKASEKERRKEDGTPNRVFIRNLPWATKEDTLVAKLSEAGNVRSAGIIMNKQNKSSGMAYADYSSSDEVDCAIKELNGKDVMGRPMSIEKFRGNLKQAGHELKKINQLEQVSEEGGTKILVKNLSWDTTEHDLTQVMESIGETREVKILISKDGRSTGRGVVEFVNVADRERCIKEVDGMDLDGRNIQVVNYLDKHLLRKSKGSTSEEETGGSETGRRDKTSPFPDPDPPHTYADTIKRGTLEVPEKEVSQGGGRRANQGTNKPLSQAGPTPKPNLRYGLAAAENFKSGIKGMGLSQVVVKGDGWCLFHAIAIGLNRAGEGLEIMKEVTSEMRDNAEYYKGFMEDNQDLETHIRRVRSIGWAGEHEIRAASKIFGRPIEIWELGIAGRPVIRKPYEQAEGSIKLVYYSGNHYNALVTAISGKTTEMDSGHNAGEFNKALTPESEKMGHQSDDGQSEGLGV